MKPNPIWMMTASVYRTGFQLKVRVTVKGDEMTVDLTDVAAQVQGFYNSGITTGHACSQVAFKLHHVSDRLSDQ